METEKKICKIESVQLGEKEPLNFSISEDALRDAENDELASGLTIFYRNGKPVLSTNYHDVKNGRRPNKIYRGRCGIDILYYNEFPSNIDKYTFRGRRIASSNERLNKIWQSLHEQLEQENFWYKIKWRARQTFNKFLQYI